MYMEHLRPPSYSQQLVQHKIQRSIPNRVIQTVSDEFHKIPITLAQNYPNNSITPTHVCLAREKNWSSWWIWQRATAVARCAGVRRTGILRFLCRFWREAVLILTPFSVVSSKHCLQVMWRRKGVLFGWILINPPAPTTGRCYSKG